MKKLVTRQGSRVVLTAVFAVLPSLGLADTQCPTKGNDGQYHTVEEGLEWCSRDHGFNEGATCGVNALGSAGIGGLPAVAAQAVLGNGWDRTNMMGATKAAFKAGKRKEAVEAAVCCQIHNPHMHKCLSENHAAVSAWLEARTK